VLRLPDCQITPRWFGSVLIGLSNGLIFSDSPCAAQWYCADGTCYPADWFVSGSTFPLPDYFAVSDVRQAGYY
jgi:hypothetical protein